MTTVKPTTRQPAKPAKDADEPSLVDQLAEDAVPEEYPPGAPELLSPLSIRPRSRRAEFKRRYAVVIERYEQVGKLKGVVEADEDPPMAEQMRIMAEMDDVYQAVDDVLRMAAVDPDAYAGWSDTVDDAELMQVFNVYQKRTQPGEASGSAS